VAGAEQARELARRARERGYGFLKVYDGVPPAAYDALVAEGRALGLAVTGHAVRHLGLPYTLRNGQVMVAHAAPFVAGGGEPGSASSLPAATELALSSGAFVTATLHVYELISSFGLDVLAGADPFARVLAQEGVEYMDDGSLEAWSRMLQSRPDIRAPVDRREELAQVRRCVRVFDEAGVPILLGADTIGIPGVVPGFSIHGELRQLREAGLTPWRALATGTRNAGDFLRRHLGAPEPVGRVEVGARADLLLLEQDPRKDPDTLRKPLLVMAAGRPFAREELLAQLETLRQGR
jgi:hypothetical protein